MTTRAPAHLSLRELNSLSRAEFAAQLGWVFENSPWVAEEAWDSRPFGTVEALAAALSRAAAAATPERGVALLDAHSEIGVLAAERLSQSSAAASEQRTLGLSRLLPDEQERLSCGQREYRRRFGFPYVVCVRDHDLGSLLCDLERRLEHDRETELRAGLAQVGRIAGLRVRDAISGPPNESETI